eukprot:scaffold330502_cov44-Prasinocladus_malaysianus.AAC.2
MMEWSCQGARSGGAVRISSWRRTVQRKAARHSGYSGGPSRPGCSNPLHPWIEGCQRPCAGPDLPLPGKQSWQK